jgi:hypothetical protein
MYSVYFYEQVKDAEGNFCVFRMHKYLPSPPVSGISYVAKYETCENSTAADRVYYNIDENVYKVYQTIYQTFSLERTKEFHLRCGWTLDMEGSYGEG